MKKLLIALLAAVMLAGCGEQNEPVNADPSSSTSVSKVESKPVSSSEPEEKEPVFYDMLTGLETTEEAALKRPVAVMINNLKAALPQRGISEASVIFEMPVESGVTRLMALFSDYEAVPEIGSIRSARHDFVEVSSGLGAYLVHIGWSEAAKQLIEQENIDHLNGLVYSNIAFFKDEERAKTKSSEHCWYTDASHIKAGIEETEAEMLLTEAKPAFNFSLEGNVLENAEMSAKSVTAAMVPGNKTVFTYDEEKGRYTKTQLGGEHIDDIDGEPIEIDNIFLMYTSVGYMADNYHKEIELESGEGFYISKGKAVKASFIKEGLNGKLRVVDGDGKELSVNTGKSYFCIMDKNEEKSLVIE